MVTHLGRLVLQHAADLLISRPATDVVAPQQTANLVILQQTADLVILQQTADPAAGTPLQYVGTFLVATLFYAITGHVAARYVLGGTPFKLALGVGLAPALASILLQQYGFLVVAPAALALDFVAFHVLYRVKYRTAAICAIMHFTISVIVGVALSAILLVVLG